ncbi:putative short chain dehydrogenase adh_short (plasmid) [Sinorhizobium fredii NGR234]|uniref:Short chain dehydrogenase adh_short n=2 Tax=Sinorhizobium fredii (strain NBRC 101917 / NGR234) TaxID=394 RepID=C3KPA6_SINFN|nr:SDR family NAD(P)-dependent oxidoreductase [Sinorhizobium fredii]ACP21914.1 putative short chain dehydrogenase adh_short [Sinorhizobium fredii NGR234]
MEACFHGGRRKQAMQRFANKVALVTGASTGIGLETIKRIREEGGTVFAAHRRGKIDIEGVASISLDVTDEGNWTRAISKVVSAAGRLDILINNAGVRESGSVEETSLEQWRRLIDTNLTSIFLGCRAAVPAIRQAGGGAIVNVGSITGIRGTENMVAYSASKSGITSMTSSLALDLASDNIRVNAVCPAAIRTRMVTNWLNSSQDTDAAEAAVLAKHPIGRIGRPDEVASVIAFLASDDSSFMTGMSIPVDGGRSIR